jgi:hypothetical protein
LDTLIGLLTKHLQTFRALDGLQVSALHAVKNQVLEGLPELLTKQSDIMSAIAQEKTELRPYLDQWELLKPEVRQAMRNGRAGEIQLELEKVAHAIQARHQEMFGADEGGANQTGQAQGGLEAKAPAAPAPDLSQTINSYRALL